MRSAMSRRTVRTMCPMNCHPTYCGMVVEVEGDRVVSIKGDKDNPDSHGFLCIRGQSAIEIVDSPERILRPRMRRAEAEAQRHTSPLPHAAPQPSASGSLSAATETG